MKKELSPSAVGALLAALGILIVGGGWYFVNASTSFNAKANARPPVPSGTMSAPPPPPPGGFPRPE